MKCIHAALLTFSLIATGLTATASDWPTYMHDITRVGSTQDKLTGALTQSWVYASPTAPIKAWPGPGGKIIEGKKVEHRVTYDDVFHTVIADGKVFFGSSVDGRIYCIDKNTGKRLWNRFTDGPIRLAPTYADGRVFVGSDDGVAYCLDANTGETVWKRRAAPRDERILARSRMTSRWPIRTSILVDNGIAYFGAGIFPYETIYLYAVEAATGKEIWRNDAISQSDASRNDLTPQGYLLASGDTLFVPSGRNLPASFSRKSGEWLMQSKASWRGDGGGQVGGSEAMLADGQIYSMAEHHILAIDQEKGRAGFGWFQGRTMTMVGDMAYTADGSEVIAVDRVAYAEASRQTQSLKSKIASINKALPSHPVKRNLASAQKAKAAYDAAQKKGAANVKSLEKALATAAAKYEASRVDYEAQRAKLESDKEKIIALANEGFAWRVKSGHQSSMIFAGGTLVVGGIDAVIGLDTKTGEQVFALEVSGEVRGLAVSDGTLTVSTTEGRVYAFGDQTNSPKTAVAASDEINRAKSPYANDKLSKMYASAAEQILANTGVTSGFCLVAGSEDGRLAYELLKRSDLRIYCIESNPAKVTRARAALLKTGMYGSRVIVDLADTAITPYPNYFANLIVSDTMLLTGKVPGLPAQIARHLKPIGGVACLGASDDSSPQAKTAANQTLKPWLAATQLLQEQAVTETAGPWTLLKRGKLPNTDDWTHQYGNAANTSSNDDRRVSDGLKVLWYGDPGPSEMVNRHQGAVGPVSANGRLFVQGDMSIMAYDAYNGEFLWKNDNPGAIRTGVFNNFEPGNMAATDDSLFMVIGDHCLRYNAATGEITGKYPVPVDERVPNLQWGYIGVHDGILYGTSTSRELIAAEARRRGKSSDTYATDQIFAYAPDSGKLLWSYRGKNISHTTIAIGDGRVFFVDSTLTAEQRENLLLEDKTELKKLTGEAKKVAEDRAKRHDMRLTVAIDAQTGKQLWAQPVDVTDCSGIGIGAGQLTVMYSKGYVLICGANANGHYWKQFLNGDFSRRRLVVLNADSGAKEWALDANYRHRPILIGQDIIAEPWSYDLCTGEQKMRTHPLTGEQTPWSFVRPGHHCGAISATPAMLLYRSRFTAFYNLETDEGTQHFAGQRMGCWINSIPAGGLVLVPEASAGCVCLFSIAATVVFEPKENNQVWGVYSASRDVTPVKHMALNLGAPGDRRDPYGKLWLSYPRPSMEKADAKKLLELPININAKFNTGGDYYAYNSESVSIGGAETNWVFSSGAHGLKTANIKLNGEGDQPADYAVTLSFTSNAGDQPNQRVFDIKLQGKTVARDVDIVARGGGAEKAVSLTFEGVHVTDNLAIELTPKKAGAEALPILTAMELLRAGEQPIIH